MKFQHLSVFLLPFFLSVFIFFFSQQIVPSLSQNIQIGALYSITNGIQGNKVAIFPRYSDGTLGPPTYAPTNGFGTGTTPLNIFGPTDTLASQNSVILSPKNDKLYVVNAASNSVSSFQVGSLGSLQLLDVYDSGGELPISLAVSPDGKNVYVLNAVGAGRLASLRVSGNRGGQRPTDGQVPTSVVTINQSQPVYPINGLQSVAAVTISPDGKYVFVSERAAANIKAFKVEKPSGRLFPTEIRPPIVTPPATPNTTFAWSFTWVGSTLIVTNAQFLNSSLSSYSYNSQTGQLTHVSDYIVPGGVAGCWVSSIGSFVIYPSLVSSFIVGATVNSASQIQVVQIPGLPLGVVNANISSILPVTDTTITPDGFFYILGVMVQNQSTPAVCAFRINSDYSLTFLACQEAADLVQGLAAF